MGETRPVRDSELDGGRPSPRPGPDITVRAYGYCSSYPGAHPSFGVAIAQWEFP